MKILLSILLVLFTALPALAGDIVVIVNSEKSIDALSKRDLVDIYMGKTRTFSDGSVALPLDQQVTSDLRKRFYRLLINKSVAQVNAYWARLLFTGRATPPRPASGSGDVLKLVKTNHDTIGYIDSDELDGSVKEIFRVN